MRTQFWIFLLFLLLLDLFSQECIAARPTMTIRPGSLVGAQGNTTFLDGTLWCVARPDASQAELQRALDCVSHASFAFSAYYQTNGNNRIACYFGGTASLTKINPNRKSQPQGLNRSTNRGGYN